MVIFLFVSPAVSLVCDELYCGVNCNYKLSLSASISWALLLIFFAVFVALSKYWVVDLLSGGLVGAASLCPRLDHSQAKCKQETQVKQSDSQTDSWPKRIKKLVVNVMCSYQISNFKFSAFCLLPISQTNLVCKCRSFWRSTYGQRLASVADLLKDVSHFSYRQPDGNT